MSFHTKWIGSPKTNATLVIGLFGLRQLRNTKDWPLIAWHPDYNALSWGGGGKNEKLYFLWGVRSWNGPP